MLINILLCFTLFSRFVRIALADFTRGEWAGAWISACVGSIVGCGIGAVGAGGAATPLVFSGLQLAKVRKANQPWHAEDARRGCTARGAR